MKTLILLPTGVADLPVTALGDRTPLEAAETPHLDTVARVGRLGMVRPVPEDLPISSVSAMLSLLGYDPRRERVGRGGLEALGLGVELAEDDLAFRMNLASTFRDHLVDFQAGPITTEEARLLVGALDEALGGDRLAFHVGMGYRHLMVVRGGRGLEVETVPPAEVQGHPLEDHLPTGPDAELLADVMREAAGILSGHDVNGVRRDLGENPADCIWLWGPGGREVIEPFELRTGRTLAVVAAVPLMKGLGRALEATVPDVPGATGYHDTDYDAKLRCALELLDDHDVVLLHLSAANEACHQTDVRLKMKILEDIDRHVVGPLLGALARRDARLLVTTDHMTSTLVNEGSTTHVPFALWGRGVESHREVRYTEEDAATGDLVVDQGHTLLELVMRPAPDLTETSP